MSASGFDDSEFLRITGFSNASFTIALWVHTGNLSGSSDAYINIGNFADDALSLEYDRAGAKLSLWDGGSEYPQGVSLSDDTWYHIAVAFTSTTAKSYINGAIDINDVGTWPTQTEITLGNFFNYQTQNWPGRIYSVKAWSTELSAEEIVSEMQTIRPQRTSNIIGWWPMLAGDRATDYSGQGNNFTETGTLADADPSPVPWGSPNVHILNIGEVSAGLSIHIAAHHYRNNVG